MHSDLWFANTVEMEPFLSFPTLRKKMKNYLEQGLSGNNSAFFLKTVVLTQCLDSWGIGSKIIITSWFCDRTFEKWLSIWKLHLKERVNVIDLMFTYYFYLALGNNISRYPNDKIETWFKFSENCSTEQLKHITHLTWIVFNTVFNLRIVK